VKLVLFDIDGTLLSSGGAGRRAMEGALSEVFGVTGPASYRYDGKTDPQIVRDLMSLAGHAPDDIDTRMEALMERYLDGLVREIDSGERGVHALRGVLPLLDALEARSDVILGLLTGNLRRGAAIKLRAAGIDPTRFRVGAFGSDHAQRPELPAIAQRRASEELGVDVRGASIVVIGDTPADIECGRAIGARAIAVATGYYSPAELARHEPAAVLADLSDTDAVVDVIINA
jgi:phosphoglycolate phosphatase